MPRRTVLSEDEETEINLSPMIDCIFILLIFFIVTTVFVEEKGLSVAKPDAAAVSALDQDKQSVVLEITEQGRVLLDSKEVALADVARGVQARVTDPETPVVIRVNEKTPHGLFVGVWDAAKRGGAVALSFSTVN
jgi:biopolymer transport protein ExbD